MFSQTDEKIDIDSVADEVSNHNGIVWTHVISLKREDAERLGNNNADKWKKQVIKNMIEISRAHNINQVTYSGMQCSTIQFIIRIFTYLFIQKADKVILQTKALNQ